MLAKRARDLRARALRNAGWKVAVTDGSAAFLAAENPLFDGTPVKQAIVDVTPDNLSQQYQHQPVLLATPDSNETPRPLAAPSIVITAAPEAPAPVVVPEPAAAPVATKGKGKKAQVGNAAGPMQQLAMF